MSWINVEQHPPKSIAWWLNEFKRDRIDTSPEYQRRSNLWSRWKQAHLIDSIINGFDIPKFYVADFNVGTSKLNRKHKPYAVIDGKQRLEAIFAFMSNGFRLNGSARYIAEPNREIRDLSYSELQSRFPFISEKLDSFVPVVMSVRSSDESLIEQMFVRLNSGVSINGAERRNAMPGPVPQILRILTLHPFFADRIRFKKDRMQEFNLAAKILLFEWTGDLVDTKAKNLDQFVAVVADVVEDLERKIEVAPSKSQRAKLEANLQSILEPYEAAEQRVMDVLEAMSDIFEDNDPLLAKQGAIPVYYWFVRKNLRMRKRFRPFLEWFEPAVLDAVRLARAEPKAADSELISYYTASRTTNDQASLKERYRLMLKRYKEWAA